MSRQPRQLPRIQSFEGLGTLHLHPLSPNLVWMTYAYIKLMLITRLSLHRLCTHRTSTQALTSRVTCCFTDSSFGLQGLSFLCMQPHKQELSCSISEMPRVTTQKNKLQCQDAAQDCFESLKDKALHAPQLYGTKLFRG